MSEGGTKEQRREETEKLLVEEQENWNRLGINLNQMQFTGTELFILQARLQALINCTIKGTMSEDDMNIEVATIMRDSMKDIREKIEPQVKEAKLEQLRQGIVPFPRVVMPWEGRDGNQ
jgi:hypothetical protein